ncbi:MAG: hypothetical protein JXA74_01460, partial [Anaerolineae bacterium]|nr:hypothetical protein [Anaerolineae bacterium]
PALSLAIALALRDDIRRQDMHVSIHDQHELIVNRRGPSVKLRWPTLTERCDLLIIESLTLYRFLEMA